MAAVISNFWSSIVEEDGLGSALENLTHLKDEEEKTISLVSRVLFLISMGIKNQKDEIFHNFLNLKKDLQAIMEESTDSFCPKCSQLKLKLGKSIQNCSPEKIVNSHSTPKKLNSPEVSRDKIECLFTSPVKEIANLETPQNKDPIIYALETQQISSKPIHNSTGRICVPETIDTNHIPRDTSGDVDIFDSSEDEISTPSDKSNLKESPIIGKTATLITPLHTIKRRSLSIDFSKPNDVKFTPKNVKVKSPPNRFISPTSHDLEPITPSPSLLGRLQQQPLDGKASASMHSKYSSIRSPVKVQEKEVKTVPEVRSEFIVTDQSKKKFPRKLSDNNSILRYEYLVDDKPAFKKKLKQTKISANSFNKKTNIAKLTGGGASKKIVDQDEELSEKNNYLLKMGIEMSLSQQNQPQAASPTDNPRLRTEASIAKKSPCKKKPSPSKMDYDHVKHRMPRGPNSSFCLPTSPLSSKRTHVTPIKYLKEDCKATSKSKSPKGVRSSLKASPYAKGSVKKSLNSTLLSETEVLIEINKDSQDDFELPKPQFKRRKIISSPQKLNDSFDFPNDKEMDPAYAFKGDVVRKKNKRQQLPGWSCHECEAYYEGASVSQKKRKLNACSRHRSKHNVVTNTPRGFWNPDWEDTLPDDKL